jgi:Tfp pilus assembly pilus retraction ATPase PilT
LAPILHRGTLEKPGGQTGRLLTHGRDHQGRSRSLINDINQCENRHILTLENLPGRALAVDVIVNTPEIKDLIREGTRLGEIRDMFSLC